MLQDNFDSPQTNDLNLGVARQIGMAAPVLWTNNATSPFFAGITSDGKMRLYRAKAGTVFAKLQKNFAAVATNVRISVDVQNMNPLMDGASIVCFGQGIADPFQGLAGYSFRLNSSAEPQTLSFYEADVMKARMDISGVYKAKNSIVIDFRSGNTVSATVNGQAFDFGAGATTYTGEVKTENYVMLGYYNATSTTQVQGAKPSAGYSAAFDNLMVTAIEEP